MQGSQPSQHACVQLPTFQCMNDCISQSLSCLPTTAIVPKELFNASIHACLCKRANLPSLLATYMHASSEAYKHKWCIPNCMSCIYSPSSAHKKGLRHDIMHTCAARSCIPRTCCASSFHAACMSYATLQQHAYMPTHVRFSSLIAFSLHSSICAIAASA